MNLIPPVQSVCDCYYVNNVEDESKIEDVVEVVNKVVKRVKRENKCEFRG